MNIPFLQDTTFTGLLSTEEYRTSYEWNKAYELATELVSISGNWENSSTIVQNNSAQWASNIDTSVRELTSNWENTFTNVQNSSASWNTAYNIATFYSQNSAILIEQTTFSELTSLKASNQLKPGQFYQINDFQLMWWNLDSTNSTLLSSEIIEPLLVLALSSNSISHEAFSTLHPEDIVYYDIDAKTSTTWNIGLSNIPNFKGWIYRRINRLNNIDICWDWRYITNNCCKFDLDPVPVYNAGTVYSRKDVVKTASNKLYISIRGSNLNKPLNNSTWWKPATNFFDDSLYYYPTTEASFETIYLKNVFSLTFILSSRTNFPTFCEDNLTPVQSNIISKNIKNIKINAGSFNIIFTSDTNNLQNLTIGEDSFNNIFAGNVNNVKVGSRFVGNFLQSINFQNVRMGHNCTSNYINLNTFNMSIGDEFSTNLIRSFVRSYDNIIGNNCSNNFFDGIYSSIIGNQAIDNTFADNIFLSKIGENFRNNTLLIFFSNNIGNDFTNNSVGNAFINNTIGNNCFNNVIGDFCNYNIIANNCSNNTIGDSFAYNKIGNIFENNTIGINFTYNSLDNICINNNFGDNCRSNRIGSEIDSNTIGSDFSYNVIENTFINNIIGNNFTGNVVGNNFIGCFIQDNFSNNVIGGGVTGINFTGATHVYNSYDKNIFTNANLIPRLSYFNTNDQLVVTDPTA